MELGLGHRKSSWSSLCPSRVEHGDIWIHLAPENHLPLWLLRTEIETKPTAIINVLARVLRTISILLGQTLAAIWTLPSGEEKTHTGKLSNAVIFGQRMKLNRVEWSISGRHQISDWPRPLRRLDGNASRITHTRPIYFWTNAINWVANLIGSYVEKHFDSRTIPLREMKIPRMRWWKTKKVITRAQTKVNFCSTSHDLVATNNPANVVQVDNFIFTACNHCDSWLVGVQSVEIRCRTQWWWRAASGEGEKRHFPREKKSSETNRKTRIHLTDNRLGVSFCIFHSPAEDACQQQI